jgi:hypothetical protein
MKTSRYLILIFSILCSCCSSPQSDNLADDKAALDKTKAAFAAAFARGDVKALVALHHPDIVKYFGGNNVVTGRAQLAEQLTRRSMAVLSSKPAYSLSNHPQLMAGSRQLAAEGQ